jgi:hypothetical protein
LTYLLLRLLAPYVHVPGKTAPLVISGVVFLTLPLFWLRDIGRARLGTGWTLALFAALSLAWAEITLGKPTGAIWGLPWRRHPDAALMMATVARPFADLFLITAAAVLGAGFARLIRDAKMLLPIVLAGALVDYWGVYHGTTNYAVTHMRGVVQSLSAGIPSLGGAGSAEGVQPVSYIGFGDWFFIALFLAVVIRHDLNPRRTFRALLAFLLPALVLVITGRVEFLPGVVPMAAAVLAVNWRRLRLSREEGFATLYAMLMVGAMIGAWTLWSRGRAPKAETTVPPAPGASAASVVDNDVETAFRSAGPVPKGSVLTADFRRAYQASGLVILFGRNPKEDRTAPAGVVETSADGAQWQWAGRLTANPASARFKPREVRYVRLTFDKSDRPLTVSEIALTDG